MIAGLLALGLSACASTGGAPKPASAPMTGPEIRRAYYYARRPYGSEAAFNPLTAFLNNGYDQVRTGPDRRFLKYDYDVQATGATKKHLAGVLLRRVAKQLMEAP